ncbi:MAG: hypothetical protein ACK5TK_00640 [Betaproteobacteria bacterium]
MTALNASLDRRGARGFALVRSSAAAAIAALSIGAEVWIGRDSAPPERPTEDAVPLVVAPWNAMDANVPTSMAAAVTDTRAAWAPYDGPLVQDWDEIEAQLPGSAGNGRSALEDPLATS